MRTFTAAEVQNIRSFNADAVVICEAGGIDKEAFENIIGRVLSTGGFILGSGTMEWSQKWYHDLIKVGKGPNLQGIKSYTLPSWSNTVVFPKGEKDPKIERARALLDPETFAVRIAAEPIRITGIALRQMKPEHIKEVTFERNLPVELWIDPGHTGAYSVLAVQRYDNQIRLIDEVYEKFLGTTDIIEICKSREWWDQVDIEDPGVIDRAAKQKQAATGSSVLDVWFENTGFWFAMTEEVIPVEDGLEQARVHLALDNHVLVSPKCQGLLAECDLGPFPEGFENEQPWHYRRNREGNFVGDRALSGADHSCTAMIYGLIHRYGYLTLDYLVDHFGPRRLMTLRGSDDIDDEYGMEEYNWASPTRLD